MFFHRQRAGRVEIAFTDRLGGCSVGPFASLNLSSATGDDPSLVEQNYALLAQGLGVDRLHSMSQVHGTQVTYVSAPDQHEADRVCDAMVTDQAGVALLVRVADCVPVLLADESAGLVAAIHAGRQGMVDGVVDATVAALQERGADSLHAWVGPRAGACCYEVPAQLAADVERAVPGSRSLTSWGTPSVDVGRGVISQLARNGVGVTDVGASTCTIENDDLFSFRREGQVSGRFAGVVVLR